MSGVFAAVSAAAGLGGAFITSQAGKKNAQTIADASTQQGLDNRETARLQSIWNNPNIQSYLGNQTYTIGPDGRPTLTQTLSPEEQAKYAKTNALQIGGLDILQGNLPNIASSISGKFGLEGSALTDYDPRYAPGKVPTSLDFSGAPGMPSADARVLQQVEDAMYGQGAQYLDPQYKQMEDATRARLANQGITAGTDAYNQELENFRLGKQKAYGDLTQSSILGGQTAMKNLYDMAMAGRQQGVGEATAQGQFGQAGAGLQAQIAANQAGIANAGRAQNYSEYAQNRTMPLNMFNALLTAGQVNAPQFQPTQPTAIQPPPTLTGAIGATQANQAGMNAGMNLFGQGLNTAARFLPGFQAPTYIAPYTDYSGGFANNQGGGR